MNSNKIIVDFGRIENILIARVVNTPKGIIDKGTIETGGEFSTRSLKFCDLCENILYLHGTEDYGKPRALFAFNTIQQTKQKRRLTHTAILLQDLIQIMRATTPLRNSI